jgi:hypothetical protein
MDAETGAPVEAAAIYSVRRTRRTSKRVGTSDANGWTQVDPEVLGRDGLVVLAPGYVEKRERARLRDVTAAAHVVELQPSFSTTLRVLLPDGLPAAGIEVTVRPQLRGLENPEPLLLATDIHGETEV